MPQCGIINQVEDVCIHKDIYPKTQMQGSLFFVQIFNFLQNCKKANPSQYVSPDIGKHNLF